MEIKYNLKKLYKNKLYLNINETLFQPIIYINSKLSSLFTLIMFDPDALYGNKIHWLITNIKTNNKTNNIDSSDILIKYKGPNPPKNSGLHHYVFCLIKQKLYIKPIEFNTRYLELNDLFDKLNISSNNKLELISIKYFVIDTN